MKNYLKILVVFMLLLTVVFSFASCEIPGSGDEEPPIGGENPPDVPPDDLENTYRIRFMYSYTVLKTVNGRDQYVTDKVAVKSIYVPFDNPVITDEIIAEINNFNYNGYTFEKWYYELDPETQVGIAGQEVDFNNFKKIERDIDIYGDRGNLAGANATWAVEFYDKSGNVIEDASDSNSGTLTISGTGAMFDFKNNDAVDIPWSQYKTKITDVVIEEGITTVGNNAFDGLTKLKNVSFPDSLTKIGNSAFSGCSSSNKAWRYLSLPANVKTIGDAAFYGTFFKEVVLNDGLESIGGQAFYGSNLIKTIVVPTSLRSIGIGAFHPGASGSTSKSHALNKVYYKGNDSDFKTVDVGMDNAWFLEYPTIYYYTADETVGNTGAYWHYAEVDGVETDKPVQYCYTVNFHLPNEKVPFEGGKIYVPVSPVVDEEGNIVTDDDGVAKLEGKITQAVIDASANLTYHNIKFVGLTPMGSAPDKLVVDNVITADVSYYVDRGNILSDGGGIIWYFDEGSGTLTISKNPDAPEGASYKMWDFVDAFDTGNLWTGGFTSLNKITKLVIEDGVEHIGDLAFANLNNVKEIVIPESVKSFGARAGEGSRAFSGCGALISIFYNGKDVKNCSGLLNEDGSLALLDTKPTVYSFTEGSTSEPGNYWMLVKDTNGTEKRLCWSITADVAEGDTVTYTNGILTIGGDDVMVNFEHPEYAPWYGAKDYITSVVFASNITSLGENTVSGYSKITSITLPNSLRVVPASALEGTNVVNDYKSYNSGLLVINGVLVKVDPTKMNKELIETYIGVRIIAGGAFDNITAVKRLYISSSVQYINPGAFDDSRLEIIYFDGGSEGWNSVSTDAEFEETVRVLYRAGSINGTGYGYWEKVGNDYVMAGCNHKYGEWVVTTEPTCIKPGVETCYCIYDNTHAETRPVPVSTDHNFEGMDEEVLSEATCDSPKMVFKRCRQYINGCEEILIYPLEGSTALGHNFPSFPDGYTQGDAPTCTESGKLLAACQNDGCDAVDEKEDPARPATGHSYKIYDYVALNCLENDGTKISYCDNGCGETDTVVEENFVKADTHAFGEYVSNGDATCKEDGTKTRTCTVCGETETVLDEGSHLLVAHSYTAENDDPGFFAGFNADKTGMLFFNSCDCCGRKGYTTFEKIVIDVDGLDDQKVPAGMYPAGKLTSSVVDGDKTIYALRLASEEIETEVEGEVEKVVNYYLNFEQKNNANSYSIDFKAEYVEGVKTYYYQHDFRWNGASSIRDNDWPLTSKLRATVGDKVQQVHNGPVNFYAEEGEDLKIGGKSSKIIAPIGEWVTFLYKLTLLDDGKWEFVMYVDGEEAAKATTTAATPNEVPTFRYEPRYSGSKEVNGETITLYNNQSFDFDKLVNYSEFSDEYTNKICAEGSHNFGEWIFEGGEAVCGEGAKEYRVCLNEKCNVVEERDSVHEATFVYNDDVTCTEDGTRTGTCVKCNKTFDEKDPEHPALGHEMGDPIYDGMVDCTKVGTETSYCSRCDHKLTSENATKYPPVASEHTWSDYEYDYNQSCTVDGTLTRHCTNDGCTVKDSKIDETHKANGHLFENYVYQNNVTCETAGTKIGTCRFCSVTDEIEDPDYPALGHKFNYIYNEDATCTQNGTKSAKCANEGCGLFTGNIPDEDHLATGHNFTEFVPVERELCSDTPYKTRTCTNERCIIDGVEYKQYVDTVVDESREVFENHTMSAYKYNHDAGCGKPGTMTAVCLNSDCTHSVTDTDPSHAALEHWNKNGYQYIDPTCTEGGMKYFICGLCNQKIEEEDLDKPALGHKFENHVYKNDAKCGIAGTMTATCSNGCGLTETVDDPDHPALTHVFKDHVYNNNEKCDKAGTMTATCSNGCGETETIDDPAHPATGHDFKDHVYNNNASCDVAGTMTAICANGCGETETKEDPNHPALGHSFVEYYYNGDRDCVTDGTETAFCTRDDCDAIDTRLKAGYEKLGHLIRKDDYQAIPDSATCQHGNETSAPCRREGCDYVDATYDDEILNYHSYVTETKAAEYFAGSSSDGKTVYFFKNCEWCGRKGPYTFEQSVYELDTLDAVKLPAGVTTGGYITGTAAPANGLWAIVLSEKVSEVTNYYLNIGKIGSPNTHNLTFQAASSDADEYIYRFDFRWNGASNIRDGGPMIVKINGDTNTYGVSASADGKTLNLYKAIEVGSGWHTINYVLNKNDAGGWTVIISVDGEELKTETIPGDAVPKVVFETRYGSSGKNSDQSFDIDNVYVGPKVDLGYSITVCEDGSHSFGEWVYNNDATCEAGGTHSRVCLAVGCNKVETEKDPEHTAIGHKYVNYIYNDDAICTKSGTMTAVCENGCGLTDTKEDPEHPATGTHTMGEWIYNNDQSCGVVGTSTRTCLNCPYFENREETAAYPALEHTPGVEKPIANSATCQHGTYYEVYCVNGCGKDYSYHGDDVLDHDYQQIICDEACVLRPNTKTAAIYKESCKWCSKLSDTTFNVGKALESESFDSGVLPSYIGATLSSQVNGAYNIILDENGNKFWRIGKESSTAENVIKWHFNSKNIISNNIWFDFRWNGGNISSSDKYAGYLKFYDENGTYNSAWAGNLESASTDSKLNFLNTDFEIGTWLTVNINVEYTEDGKSNIVATVYDSSMNPLGSKSWKADAVIEYFAIHCRWNWNYISYDFDNVAIVSEHNCVASEFASLDFIKTAATATTPAEYYHSCVICGKLFDTTFTHGSTDTNQVGKAPTVISGVTLPGTAMDQAPTTDADGNNIADGRYTTIKTDNVTNANGENVTFNYIEYIDDNNVGSNKFALAAQSRVDGKTVYSFDFDFRFQGAGNFRTDNNVYAVVYTSNIGATSNGLGYITSASDGSSATMLGKTLTKGEWYHITYEFVDNGSNYTINIYIDGENVKTISGTEISFSWEIRWGQDASHTNNVYFDLANISYTAK